MARDPLTARIIGCAIEVHRALGPGLLESAYERCLAYELTLRGVPFRQQVPVLCGCPSYPTTSTTFPMVSPL